MAWKPLTKDDRKLGLEFADQVAELAATGPHWHFKRSVYRTASSLRQYFGFSDEEKMQILSEILSDVPMTLDDICEAADFSKDETIGLLELMITAGRCARIKTTGALGGRPTTLYRTSQAHQPEP